MACFLAIAAAAGGGEALPDDWEENLRKELSRKVSFEYADTPLREAMMFLLSMSRANVILDPAVARENFSVTLKVKDVPMHEALKQIMDKAGLEFQPGDMAVHEALFIHRKGVHVEAPSAPLTPAQLEALSRAVADLGANDFGTRQNASRLLAAMGPAAAAPLRAASAEVTDPEVRLRLNNLLSRFEKTDFDAETPEVAKALEALDRRVSFELVDTPLGEVVQFLASLTKQKFEAALPEREEQPPVSLRVQNMKLSNALRWIARLSGARLSLRDGALVFEKRP